MVVVKSTAEVATVPVAFVVREQVIPGELAAEAVLAMLVVVNSQSYQYSC